MNPRSPQFHRQRWAMINECIAQGIWEDLEQMRRWLYAEFGTTSTRKLTDAQLRIFAIYLKWYLGKLQQPPVFDHPLPWRINQRQEWRIEQFMKALNWSVEQENGFIFRQLGVHTFRSALSRNAARKVILGLEKVYDYYNKKEKTT